MSADNSATDPAFQQLSPDNHGPWVVVTSCIFILLTALVVAVRLISGFRLARQVNLSDWLIVVATVGWGLPVSVPSINLALHSLWLSGKPYV